MSEIIDPVIDSLKALEEVYRLKKLNPKQYKKQITSHERFYQSELAEELNATLDYLGVNIEEFTQQILTAHKSRHNDT